jgi:hypothetical protein
MDKQAEQLYNAVMRTLQGPNVQGLLAAVADAQSRVPWLQVSEKTRAIFLRSAVNLTVQGAKD